MLAGDWLVGDDNLPVRMSGKAGVCPIRMIRFDSGGIARLAGGAVCAAAMAGCQGITGVQQAAEVRVIDASPDAPAMDIAQIVPVPAVPMGLYNIGFGTVSTYIPTAAGAYTHAAMVAGTGQQLASARGVFAAGGQYTLLAGNIAAGMQLTVLKDQAAPAPAGQIALRFLGEATRPGAVDVYLVAADEAATGMAPIASGVNFGWNSGYVARPAGTYSIVVYAAGTAADGGLPIYTGSEVSYAAGTVRTALLVDRRGEGADARGLQVIAANDYDPAE